MTRPQFAEGEHRAELQQAIAEQIGPSRREAAQWITNYQRALEEPASQVDAWQQRIAAERKLLSDFGEKHTTSKIVRDLYRWQAEQLQKLERREEAIDSVRQMIALSDGSRQQLLEIIDWLMQRKAWTVVDEVVAKFPDNFQKDPFLLYRLAEAQTERGDKEVGEKTAEQALALAPMNSHQHLEVAYQLQERGRFAWSEREYRTILKSVEMISRDGVDVRSMLAEMLHDLGRETDAAAVLSDVVQAMEADETVRDTVESVSLRRSPSEIISRMYFFAAADHVANGRIDKAREALQKGADANAEDADLLIAMYRLPQQDDEWKKKTDELIETAATEFRNMVDQMQRLLEDSENEQNADNIKNLQAMYCNQYAWLIGNTRGDFEEAIRLSRRSLEIRPESAGYMDTLGHCYFNKGDFENAIKWQSKAAKLEPYSGQIVRALAEFEKAASEKQDK
jgi:tetratricopeptide (TPR) repeat protein